MKIELIGEIAEYYGEQNPDLAPLPKKGIVLSATEDELQAVRFPKMQGELALVPSETAYNAAKLREALELARFYMSRAPEAESRPYVKNGQCEMLFLVDVLRTVDAALAAPARNCDVGTAEEQSKRFEVFCSLHHLPKGKGCYSCPAIPKKSPNAFHRNVCKINWAQMPYEEGGKQ